MPLYCQFFFAFLVASSFFDIFATCTALRSDQFSPFSIAAFLRSIFFLLSPRFFLTYRREREREKHSAEQV
jgi:hypothetical protein